jgi:hypothetical protein
MVFALGIASLTHDGKVAFSGLDEDVSIKITYALDTGISLQKSSMKVSKMLCPCYYMN